MFKCSQIKSQLKDIVSYFKKCDELALENEEKKVDNSDVSSIIKILKSILYGAKSVKIVIKGILNITTYISNFNVRLNYQSEELTDISNILKDSRDRKSTRLNSSHANISYAVFCLKKKKY